MRVTRGGVAGPWRIEGRNVGVEVPEEGVGVTDDEGEEVGCSVVIFSKSLRESTISRRCKTSQKRSNPRSENPPKKKCNKTNDPDHDGIPLITH